MALDGLIFPFLYFLGHVLFEKETKEVPVVFFAVGVLGVVETVHRNL